MHVFALLLVHMVVSQMAYIFPINAHYVYVHYLCPLWYLDIIPPVTSLVIRTTLELKAYNLSSLFKSTANYRELYGIDFSKESYLFTLGQLFSCFSQTTSTAYFAYFKPNFSELHILKITINNLKKEIWYIEFLRIPIFLCLWIPNGELLEGELFYTSKDTWPFKIVNRHFLWPLIFLSSEFSTTGTVLLKPQNVTFMMYSV